MEFFTEQIDPSQVPYTCYLLNIFVLRVHETKAEQAGLSDCVTCHSDERGGVGCCRLLVWKKF